MTWSWTMAPPHKEYTQQQDGVFPKHQREYKPSVGKLLETVVYTSYKILMITATN